MSRTTGIEWTEHTWNPIVGCSVLSAGCTNCYAMRQAHRIESFGTAPQYEGTTQSSKGGPVWTGRVNRATDAAMRKPIRIAGRAMIFVNSMSDLFHDNALDEWRLEAIGVMRAAGRHTYQVLTKRPENAVAFFNRNPLVRWPEQAWLGVSVEDGRVKHRIDILRELPAETRFLSIEPLIGPVGDLDLRGIHWVITGGESGPGARFCDPEWIYPIRDQCETAGVPLFHKQWGHYRNNPLVIGGMSIAQAAIKDPHGKGGGLLDGRLYRDFPAIQGLA